ncbi:MAG: D-alanyl-D-alanine carboxypeptidase family protein, partial [Acidobacteriota bacterium]
TGESVLKKVRVYLVVIVAALAVLAGAASFAARSSRGQSQSPKGDPRVKPTVLVSERGSSAGKNASSAFAAAAGRNALLENELIWKFGGKQQTGWYLYHSLIDQLLKTRNAANSTEFAAALAAWQRQTGLIADGVLDESSLMAMVAHWQSRRLKDRTPALPDQLVTAPSSDFYDPERLAELREVERSTYAAYKQMVAAAVADPTLKLAHTTSGDLAPTEKYFKIISAFRSREYQEKLRRESPNAGSAGLAVNSPHFTGRALDVYVGGDPVETKDSNRAIQINTPVYRWLARNAERFGFRPYFYEPWHWEYIK